MTRPFAPILINSAIALSIIPSAHAQTQRDPAEMTIEHDVAVATRAGFDVMINVYRPNKPGEFPVLISMGPYGKDDLPAEYDGIFGAGQIVVSQYAAFETPDPEYWVHNGYVVIAADSPGSNRSGGDLDIFGAIEANAFYDVIEWANVPCCRIDWSLAIVGTPVRMGKTHPTNLSNFHISRPTRERSGSRECPRSWTRSDAEDPDQPVQRPGQPLQANPPKKIPAGLDETAVST